ncbi:hypothetical protein NDU88_005709 [Pleurodeles waltl]|uniref:Uncharacterized protein n=1 Tax=Pleurodeles waltl TaxID=8319 RepID=A0AAV7QFZ8_PLEWA|nr:hypothetical protein NDU88_005709 [Pleurodeles waltl]
MGGSPTPKRRLHRQHRHGSKTPAAVLQAVIRLGGVLLTWWCWRCKTTRTHPLPDNQLTEKGISAGPLGVSTRSCILLGAHSHQQPSAFPLQGTPWGYSSRQLISALNKGRRGPPAPPTQFHRATTGSSAAGHSCSGAPPPLRRLLWGLSPSGPAGGPRCLSSPSTKHANGPPSQACLTRESRPLLRAPPHLCGHPAGHQAPGEPRSAALAGLGSRPKTRSPARTADRPRASSMFGPPVPHNSRHHGWAPQALPIGVGKRIQGLGGGARTNASAHAAILATPPPTMVF